MSDESRLVPGKDRSLDAYYAEPAAASEPRGAILVVHEIFGLDDHIRDVARRFAGIGYIALAPDLFTGPRARTMTPENVQLALRALRDAPASLRSDPSRFKEFVERQPAERRPILETLAAVSSPGEQEGFAGDLRMVARYLRTLPGVAPGRVGAVGFCIGGTMVGGLATVDPELRAAVVFYGQNPPLERVPQIRAHVLGLYGAEDTGITSMVPALAEAMQRAGRPFQYHVYPGARHAFFNDRRPNYHAQSARDAWDRVRAFFAEELGVPPGGPTPRSAP